MRTLLLVVLVIANLGVRWASRDLRRERAELRAALEESRRAAEANRERARGEASLEALVERFKKSFPGLRPGPIDITALRESLLTAESGLELDRLSLDFRPLSSGTASAAANGSRIQLSSRGTFHALAAYLGRLEVSGLPLAPEELRLRRESDGRVALDARWSSLWNVKGELSEAEASRVAVWLEGERDVTLERDLFVEEGRDVAERESASDLREPLRADASPAEVALEPAAASRAVPALTGFVLARPELEPDVDRRVLAALRFEGQIHLMKVGEDLGDYEVAAMEALQSVTLIHAPTGERVVLHLP